MTEEEETKNEERKSFKLEVKETSPKDPVGCLEVNLSKFVMERLQSYIEEAKINPVNHNACLAGNISKSLLMKDKDDWFFNSILEPLIGQFYESFPLYNNLPIFAEDAPFCLNKFWVNFQKENEFNPLHNHSGVFSFVIWVKIPTDWREQHALPISANSGCPYASNFVFYYISMLGDLAERAYHLDRESEGMMLFFPAKLQHCVYPFYNCAEERVSISGNISFDVSEDSMKQYKFQMLRDQQILQ